MIHKVSILDIGLGNIRSVTKAFEMLADEASTISTSQEILAAEAIVLPGVGAFQDGMKKLNNQNLVEALKQYSHQDKPLFGICLGMQLLMSKSSEFGECAGLDIVKGECLPFKHPDKVKEPGYKVPHVGWNQIVSPKKTPPYWDHTILEHIPDNTDFYFVHSYCVYPADKKYILAETTYGKQKFCSALKKGNIYGTQFHPEKSGKLGIKLVETWLEAEP
jgi:imidazole glycerol-phosphate synthase subunit HisH